MKEAQGLFSKPVLSVGKITLTNFIPRNDKKITQQCNTYTFCFFIYSFPYFHDVWQRPLKKNITSESCKMLIYQNSLLWTCCTQAACNRKGAVVKCSYYDDVIMSAIASQITSLTIVYSTVYPGADQSKHQSSASLAFVWGIHRGPVNSPHKWPLTRKMFPFDDVIM